MTDRPIKLRVLKSEVVEGATAAELASAQNAFYLSKQDSEAELVSIIQVAEFAVMITYTE